MMTTLPCFTAPAPYQALAIQLLVALYVGDGLTDFTQKNSSSYCEIGPFRVTCALR